MKKLDPPVFDDVAALEDLSASNGDIAGVLRGGGKEALLALYAQYDSLVATPQNVNSGLPAAGIFSSLLLRAYESPPGTEVEKLKKIIQRKLSPNICPMCGSSSTFSADHYFPKTDLAEFSVYSKNLVPACNCNSQRQTSLAGPNPDEWIMHPYYEHGLQSRIITIEFDFSQSEPSLHIGKIYPPGIPPARIDYHVKHVHEKTTMLEWLSAEWAQLNQNPRDSMSWYPSAPVTIDEVKFRIHQLVDASDRKLGTPNNWTSALFHGVENSPQALCSVFTAVNNSL